MPHDIDRLPTTTNGTARSEEDDDASQSAGSRARRGDTGSKHHFLARAATLMLTSDTQSNAVEAARSVIERLRNDARVPTPIDDPELNDYWTDWSEMFPARKGPRAGVLRSDDRMSALHLSSPVSFTVRVPIQHQPTHHGSEPPRSDTYGVAWDGITAIVVWEQDDADIPISGGHIVAKVLEDAAKAAGFGLYSQSCSPGCDYVFMHTTMRVEANPEATDLRLEKIDGDRAIRAILDIEFDDDLEAAALFLLLGMGTATDEFAEFKNLARRIQDIEGTIRNDIGHLLSHNYEHALGRTYSPRKRLKAAWNNRSWRREGRALIAGLWLSLSNLDTLTRRWETTRRNLDTIEADAALLFSRDYSSDVRAIEDMDLAATATVVDQVSEGMNSRVLALATSGGALGGAVAAAAITWLHH
jgi:hypothetical protein